MVNRQEQEKRFLEWVKARDDDWWEDEARISIWDFRVMQEFFNEDLFNTLTEFEREIREDMFKIDQPTLGEAQRKFEQLHHKADSLVVNKLDGVIQAIYYSPTAQMRKTAIEDSLSQLEKEKHPKK